MEHLFIPLPRRIQEIIKERGKLSQEFVASRIGIHRDTFRAVLRGERPIYGMELRKLAEALKISVDRLNQTDMMKDIAFLDQCLNRLENMDKALVVAEKFLARAVGITERHDALNYLGRVCFELRKYGEAHQYWIESYDIAHTIFLNYAETDRLHNATKNLVTSYTVRKDFANAQAKIDGLKQHFHNDPSGLGTMYYSLGMIAFGNGDLAETKSCLYESLLHFQKTGDAKQIGNAEHCVGSIEYLLGHLPEAHSMFQQAIRTLSPFLEAKLNATKDYIKVLLKLGQQTEVQRLLRQSQVSVRHFGNKDLQIKFKLLHMIANHDLSVAKSLLASEEANTNQKRIACRFIMEHYRKSDDLQSFIRYYEMERSFTEVFPLFDEEGL